MLLLGSHFMSLAFVEPEAGRDAIFLENLLTSPALLSEAVLKLRTELKSDDCSGEVAVQYVSIGVLVAEPTYSVLCAHNLRVLSIRGERLFGRL